MRCVALRFVALRCVAMRWVRDDMVGGLNFLESLSKANRFSRLLDLVGERSKRGEVDCLRCGVGWGGVGWGGVGLGVVRWAVGVLLAKIACLLEWGKCGEKKIEEENKKKSNSNFKKLQFFVFFDDSKRFFFFFFDHLFCWDSNFLFCFLLLTIRLSANALLEVSCRVSRLSVSYALQCIHMCVDV